VVAAMVTNPNGTKVGLPTTPRIMWVIYTETVYQPPQGGHGPATDMSPGTVLHALTLVDDETLQIGGNFAC
jgi:hypothetical protein